MKGGIQQGATTHVHNMVVEAGKSGAARLRSAGTVIQNRANVMVNKAKEGTIEGAKLADKSITGAKNFFQIPQEGMALAGVGPVGKTREVFENTHAVENRVRDIVSRAQGVNLQGTGKDYKNYKDVEYTGTTKVNGEVRDTSRRVYQRIDIDYERVGPRTGKTNYQLMKSGRPPIWKDGTKIELHHLIQREPGSMVELPE